MSKLKLNLQEGKLDSSGEEYEKYATPGLPFDMPLKKVLAFSTS